MAKTGAMDISERSMKFYNGTYSLVADGFTDELGVYRAFDCYDPAARAPTPLPSGLGDDSVDGKGSGYQLRDQSHTKSTGVNNAREGFRFPSSSANSPSMMIPRNNLLHGYKDRDYLLGKLEGIQLASRRMGMELSQADCYQLCGIPFSEDVQRSPTKTEDSKQPTSNKACNVHTHDAASPLSDCPSDISDWEVSQEARTARKDMTHLVPKQQVVQDGIRSKRSTTRGIAQKVPKAKKTSGSRAREVRIPPERVSSRRRAVR